MKLKDDRLSAPPLDPTVLASRVLQPFPEQPALQVIPVEAQPGFENRHSREGPWSRNDHAPLDRVSPCRSAKAKVLHRRPRRMALLVEHADRVPVVTAGEFRPCGEPE